MTLSGKEKAALRGEAHHLTAVVHVGKEGLTPTVFQSLDDALRTRELVKVQLGKTVDTKARDVANALAMEAAAEVVQVIGRTFTLYRRNPELKRKAGELPPWRR
jgi:RNA-binding protein